MPFTVGETVGPYRLVEQLGQGGMATVFKAYHAALDRYVAIKVLHTIFKADPSFLARFQREARVVARLEHPNIVPVYDYAEYEGAPFLVMKFIPGETLKARLARGPLSAAEVLRCIEAVGAALEFAHGQGVLHRDVKPSNIMLAGDRVIFLTDFGLARMAQAGESTLSFDTMLGTPSYMSPEQARGDKELDAGTDIYSFGVVVYELVVGRVPFSADTPYAVIHDHIFTPLPPPRLLNPAVPESVEAVLLRALAKDRAERYAGVGEMVAELRRALGPQDAATGPLPSSSIAATPTIVAAPDAVTPSAARGPSTVVRPIPPSLVPLVIPSSPSGGVVAPTKTEPAPAPLQTTGAPEPPVRAPYRLRWWQLAIGVIVVAGCLLLALSALSRAQRQKAASTATAAAVTGTHVPVTATPIAIATGVTEPAIGAAQQHLQAAERAFVAGQIDAGLAQLDQAVAVNPSDTAVLVRAGDLTLAQRLALDSLSRYYLPGIKLELAAPDPRSGLLQSHTALAFYVAAADQKAANFLDTQVIQYPDHGIPLVARQRYQIFFASGQGAQAQLEPLAKNNAQGALPSVVLGDYYLARGQLADAVREYTQVADMRLSNGYVPDWIIRESRCDLEAIKTQHANAKVEASCVDLLSLLTGK